MKPVSARVLALAITLATVLLGAALAGTYAARLPTDAPAPLATREEPEAAAPPEAPPARIAREGDRVVFHLDAYDEAGGLAFTSDPDLARVAIEGGNALLDPDLNGSTYLPRRAWMAFAENPNASSSQRAPLHPARFLIGHAAGDVVRTPLIVDPFGEPETRRIPRSLGPVSTTFTIDLASAYSEENASATQAGLGSREGFAPGALVPYAQVLEARVVSLEGDVATLVIQVPESRVVESRVLGAPLKVVPLPEGQALVEPQLRVGDVFTTQGCKLPMDDVPPGRYRVVAQDGEGFVVEEARPFVERLYEGTFRFEFRVIEVQAAPVQGDATDLPEQATEM